MDSHSDSTVLGKGCLVVHYFDWPVNVTGYDPEYGSKVCQTVTGVLAYDCPKTGKPYLVVINQAICMDHLEHHLMCTMQCRMNGIKTNQTPKYHSKAPDESTHDFQVEYLSD